MLKRALFLALWCLASSPADALSLPSTTWKEETGGERYLSSGRQWPFSDNGAYYSQPGFHHQNPESPFLSAYFLGSADYGAMTGLAVSQSWAKQNTGAGLTTIGSALIATLDLQSTDTITVHGSGLIEVDFEVVLRDTIGGSPPGGISCQTADPQNCGYAQAWATIAGNQTATLLDQTDGNNPATTTSGSITFEAGSRFSFDNYLRVAAGACTGTLASGMPVCPTASFGRFYAHHQTQGGADFYLWSPTPGATLTSGSRHDYSPPPTFLAPVPEPSAGWMLAVGLITMAGSRIRLRSRGR